MSNLRTPRFGSANRRTNQTIRVLDQGSIVTALHTDLRAQQFVIADDELDSGRFGATTQRAVATFQRQQGLEPTGIVEERTRSALREAARAGEERELRERWRRSIGAMRRTSRR